MPPVRRSPALLVGLLLLALAGLPVLMRANTQPAIVPLYFTGLVGEDTPEGRLVLLRWYALEELITLESAVIFRSSATSPRQKISVVKKMRDENTILSVFYSEGRERVRQDLVETLERIYGGPIDQSNLATLLIDMLEAQSGSDADVFRRIFLIQGNYGAAIVEGLGYLDCVPDGGPWTYELWKGDADGEPLEALGRVIIDASAATKLPAPANLREVELFARGSTTELSESMNQRIFLNWDIPPSLEEVSGVMFGFDIYRLGRDLEAGETFESVFDEVIKVNDLPVMPMSSSIEDEDPSQAYLYADWGDGLEGGDLLPVGAVYTYWAVPRDLLGQRGNASDPVTVVVKDTSAPKPPKGLSVVRQNDANGTPFLLATWDKQTEDTVSYNVYRFQNYANVQDKSPFPPIDGFAEGLIHTGISQPTGDLVSFIDMSLSGTTGKVFWYCVSAVDAHGNESAMTPPVFGVIDDLLGPAIAGDVRICYDVVDRVADVRVATFQPNDRPQTWRARFTAAPGMAGFTTLQVDRYDFGSTRPRRLADIPLEGSRLVEAVDEIPGITHVSNAPRYCFRLVDSSGIASNEVCIDPPDEWEVGAEAVYTASGARDPRRECRGNDAGPRPVDRTPGSGPVTFEIPCPPDVVEVRLYRSLDCENYALVEEVECSGGSVQLTDTYAPAGLAEVCYMIQGHDANGNPGPKFYLQPTFQFYGGLPKPTLKTITATGNQGDPTASLVWIGPKAGVSHYNVYFTRVGDPDPANPLQFSAATTNFNPSTAEFSATALRADNDLTPIDPFDSYLVRVEAVAFNNAKAESAPVPFNWGVEVLQDGVFNWPPRPLPSIIPHPNPVAFFNPSQLEFLIPLATEGVVRGRHDPRVGLIPNLPFTLWRRRVDIPNQPWVNVFPLFENILVVQGAPGGPLFDLTDPFFGYLEPTPNLVLLATRDDTGLTFDAQYQWYYVSLDPESYEIDKLVGPITGTVPPSP